MVRYSFPVPLFHRRLHAGLARRTHILRSGSVSLSFENGRRYIVEKAELTELIRSIPVATMAVFIPRCGEPAVGHSFENSRR